MCSTAGHKEMSSILVDHSAPLYERKNAGGGGGKCGVSAYEYSCAHGALINFGDLAQYLTYGVSYLPIFSGWTKIYVETYLVFVDISSLL